LFTSYAYVPISNCVECEIRYLRFYLKKVLIKDNCFLLNFNPIPCLFFRSSYTFGLSCFPNDSYSNPGVDVGVCINRSLVLFVCFEDCCLSFYPFSVGHCVVCLLPFTHSDYPFRIVKPFLYLHKSWMKKGFGKCLRQVEPICGHFWHIYSIAVNQIMVATAYNCSNKNIHFMWKSLTPLPSRCPVILRIN
jgi:hypothetical protein